MPARKREGLAIRGAGNPELNKALKTKALQDALAERAERRAMQAKVPEFIFDQDHLAAGASRNLRIKISREYDRYHEVVSANDGNRELIFREWRLATNHLAIAEYLRWCIGKRNLRQIKEVINPKVRCGVEGCNWSGLAIEIRNHYMEHHVLPLDAEPDAVQA